MAARVCGSRCLRRLNGPAMLLVGGDVAGVDDRTGLQRGHSPKAETHGQVLLFYGAAVQRYGD